MTRTRGTSGLLALGLLACTFRTYTDGYDPSFDEIDVMNRGPARSVTIEGTVLHRLSEAPIVNTRVHLECGCLPAPRDVWTDQNGEFRVHGLPPGEYIVCAGDQENWLRRWLRARPGQRFRVPLAVTPAKPGVWIPEPCSFDALQ